MKRTSSGTMKNGKDVDLFGRPMKTAGAWQYKGDNDVWIFTHDDIQPSEKVAAFDMDGTLIRTKSGKVFPIDTNDWKLLNDQVAKKLKEHSEKGFKIVIFTNQKGIHVGKVDKKGFKRKIEGIIAKIGVPIQAFVAISGGIHRKPCTGMWDELQSNNGDVKIDKEASFFVGDAAGRSKSKIRPKKDHSKADRLFADNVGLRFLTPEQFFEGAAGDEPWEPPAFQPKDVTKNEHLLEPHDAEIPSSTKELIVMVGFPGSGKSTFAKHLADEYGYTVVNRDTLGTWQKCVAAAKFALNEGKSVVVDNTNPDVESRARYTSLAKELKVQCRCFKMNGNMAHAQHNIRFRQLTRENGLDVSTMVLRMHAGKFKEPDLSEGFKEIVSVNFKPRFETTEHEKLYSMYLVE